MRIALGRVLHHRARDRASTDRKSAGEIIGVSAEGFNFSYNGFPPMPTKNRQRFLVWPGKRVFGEAFIPGGVFALFFAAVYGTTDYIAQQRESRVRVDFDFERNIPFVAPMLVFYVSIYPLFCLAPFILRTRRECRALAASMAVTTAIAGVGFLLCPAELAFPPPDLPSSWELLYAFADGLNLQYNLLPSLHVALSVLCVDVFSRRWAAGPRLVLWAWGIAIMLSTVLTHQHHVLDVATGFLLAIVVSRFVYPVWATSTVGEDGPAASPVDP
jgi:membrane-associated phospholipid phosphatase